MALKKEVYDIKKVQPDKPVLKARKITRIQKEVAKYGYILKKEA